MIFENLPYSCAIVLLICLIIGFIISFLFFASKAQFKSKKSILQASLCSGLGIGFAFTVIFCSFVPTVVIVDEDLNHKRVFSFFAQDQFLGIGGSYISNESSYNLRLIGIGSDNDINIPIRAHSTEKSRRCPQSYFKTVPESPISTTIKTAKGKKKISGPKIFLIIE